MTILLSNNLLNELYSNHGNACPYSNKSAALTQVIQTGWKDVWDVLSDECKNEILIIDPNDLLFTMDKYLKKHR